MDEQTIDLADQLNRHKKVFTRWINLQLAKAKPPVEVTDLISEFRDGRVLLTLVELLLGIQVTRSEPTTKRINQIRNVQEAMRHLLRNNVRTTGIIASEITAGDDKAIIGFLWSIIQRFQVIDAIKPDPRDYGVDNKLLTWCQECIKGNSKNVRVLNLTTSWKDGLAFNALLHSFNPSLFDLDAISSNDVKTRLTHAFNLATNTYGVPPLLDPEDVGVDTPDKNLITLFLSYVYQLISKGSTVKIVKKELITRPTETTKEYEFKTITTRHETSRSGGTAYDVNTITTTQEENPDDELFHDIKTITEGGQEKVLYVKGFPQKIQIEERKAFIVSPFRKPTSGSSRTSSSSGASSPTSGKDSDTKEFEEEALKLTPSPRISGEGSYEYTVTTKRITSNSGGRVTSTTTNKTLQTSMADSKTVIKVTNGNKAKDSVALTSKGDEKDAKTGDRTAKETVITDKKMKEREKIVLNEKEDEKDTKTAYRTVKETTINKKIKGKESQIGKEQTPKNSSGGRDVLLISTERISRGGGTGGPVDPVSSHSVTEEDGGPASDVGPPRYFKYIIDNSTPPRYMTLIDINCKLGGERENTGYRSDDFVDYLKKKLDTVDQNMFDLERSSKHSDKDSMDLKFTKNALDQHKEVLLQLQSFQSTTYVVLEEGRQLVKDKRFDQAHAEYFSDRMDATVTKMKTLEDNINKEHQRLFDLYMILLKQHLERMNDWLVRAESRMALDDVIEPTYEGVQQQVSNHQTFQEELSNYSMVNMILDMDLDDPVVDESIRDWIKVLSERWAAVWTWAEEWKEKLNQAQLDWNKFREEEIVLLSWLSSKEQTLDVIGETDITNEEQVNMHSNLLETLEREMGTQGRRLASLHETGEKLIKDAEYRNSTAKGIRDQLEDFDRCWAEINSSIKERKAMLQNTQNKLKQMGNLMKEVRAWLDDTEALIKFVSSQEDPQKENKIQEKIELKCEERERNQLKVDEINRLEDELSRSIDKTSNNDMKRVTKPFNKRWNDTSMALNRYRNEDYPFIKPDDCFLVKCLKKALVAN